MTAQAVLRGWRLATLLVVAVALGGAAAVFFSRDEPPEDPGRAEAARLMGELMSGKAQIGGPFTLTDPNGRRTSLTDFRGKLVVLYFGYTFCPDVCPTDLSAIARLMEVLGGDADKVQPVFVTLDPERDSPALLREYVAAFDRRFVALRGTEAETRPIALAYKVYFSKVRPPGSSAYFIDHTAFTYLLDREGKYVAFFPPGTSAERMSVMVREAL